MFASRLEAFEQVYRRVVARIVSFGRDVTICSRCGRPSDRIKKSFFTSEARTIRLLDSPESESFDFNSPPTRSPR